ncbi:rab9 effector protein with kelch motifs-like isoform X3 [Ambystoma mexicanum]|uniref:rab9 effector protein with kelch motifs-like isoform X3 n=1 Tax=Ambystoma mexicanum TaxID=8296 RepID=UPI0037E7C440
MARLEFFTLWSVEEPPRQLLSKCGRMRFQTPLPLPLPKLLVIFGLGDWSAYSHETEVTAEVCLSPDKQSQRIGKLSTDSSRSLVWEGDWRLDFLMDSRSQADRGVPAKLILTVSGQLTKGGGFSSSTPARKRSATEPPQSHLLSESTIPLVRPEMPLEQEYPTIEELESSKEGQQQTSEATQRIPKAVVMETSPPPAKRQALARPALANASHEADVCKRWEEATRNRDLRKTLPPQRAPRKLQFGGRRPPGPQLATVCPSPRWGQALCLSDPETAILMGGEGPNQQPCTDSLWKLEIDSDFWFPMETLSSGPTPQCSIGHSATYDPESKRIYIFGGMREGTRFSSVHILDTLTWKWMSVKAVGKVPTLAHHSATIYHKELYVFGGMFPPQAASDHGPCSNLLYIFNPEYSIWYQPIVEGERPLPRFGHSATLLRNQVLIFGGRRPPVYLNDVHILDLGFMEYTSVRMPTSSGQPSPRCFHAAMPVSDHKMLISGGCGTAGSLMDAFIFDVDTTSWSSIPASSLNGVPRAGHSMLNLCSTNLMDSDKETEGRSGLCSVLVFGGSDCAGTFYKDTVRIHVDLNKDCNRGH